MTTSTMRKLPERLKNRKTFVANALAAEKQVKRTGRAYPAGQVHRYLRARVAGKRTKRPKPAQW